MLPTSRATLSLGKRQRETTEQGRQEVGDDSRSRDQLRDDFKWMVAQQLTKAKVSGDGPAGEITWSQSSTFPCLRDVNILRPVFEAAGVTNVELCFHDFSGACSAHSRSGGLVRLDPAVGLSASVKEKAKKFSVTVEPLSRAEGTHRMHFQNWGRVLAWAVANGEESSVLPMTSIDTLKALLWDSTQFGCSIAQQKALINAVQDRHRRLGLMPPAQEGLYSRLVESLERTRLQPQRERFGVDLSSVQNMLRKPTADWSVELEVLAVGLGFLCATRPIEVVSLRMCHVCIGADQAIDPKDAGLKRTARITLPTRKQDREGRGHDMRVGRPKSEEALDILGRLENFWSSHGMSISSACTSRYGLQTCEACFPVFPMSTRGGQCWSMKQQSVEWFSKAVRKHIGEQFPRPELFSGHSVRIGAITTAQSRGLSEAMIYMQSGHGKTSSGRTYMRLVSKKDLYAFYNCFNL